MKYARMDALLVTTTVASFQFLRQGRRTLLDVLMNAPIVCWGQGLCCDASAMHFSSPVSISEYASCVLQRAILNGSRADYA